MNTRPLKTRLFAAALAASLTIGGSAYALSPAQSAQDAPAPRGGGILLRADTNKDGIVTRAEMIADAEARFAKRDTNKDGKIGADERPQAGTRGRR
ncbi:hypothetical protein P1X14_01025, partial [Sphingomonas sp. AOB5]|nr:hypothetical protein [Sphingomonas sp. AOB5]